MMLPFCPTNACLVEVLMSWPVLGLEVAVERPMAVSYLAGYVSKVGVRRAAQKVASRMFASDTEQLVVLAGVGRVSRASVGQAEHELGDLVLFMAPRAHASARHVVTSPLLMIRLDERPNDLLTNSTMIALVKTSYDAPMCAMIEQLAGWSVHADWALDPELCAGCMTHVARAWRNRTGEGSGALADAGLSRSARRLPLLYGERASVVLFGWGHYARTCLMPHLTERYDIMRVHEIDPILIGTPHHMDVLRWSTSPGPDPGDELAALWCVAGYHHHHARLATEALKSGVDVLVEKPLITCESDLDVLLDAWRASSARLWQGFHRRTWQVHEWLLKDLKIQKGTSVVHYHCVVHEVNLPVHHWYRWEASGSRLIMNGCHWLDEFMHLNGYREPVHMSAQSFQGGEVIMVQVELDHGATFSMSLSSVGSDRIGVRESTHVSCGERSACLTDWRYVAEHATGELRQARCDEATTYARMIAAVSTAQQDPQHPGESIIEVERFWRMVCALDAMCAE